MEPTRLRAGVSWSWDRYPSADFLPSDGWALSYTLRRGNDGPITVTGSGSADHFEMRVTGAASAAYPPGRYLVLGKVSKSGAVYVFYEGVLIVEPDLATAKPSHAERMVAALEARLEALAGSGEVTAFTEGAYSETRGPFADLTAQLGIWRDKVRRERGGKALTPVRGRFG